MVAGEVALGKFIATGVRWARTTRMVNLIRGARIATQGALVRGAVALGGRLAGDVPVSADLITGAMQRTAVVKQAPLASSIRNTRSVMDDIGRTVDDGHARAVQFLRHTDRRGSTFLLRAGNRIRTFPMRTVLAIEDRVAMWRTLSRARAQNPNVGVAEVGTAMRRYGSLQRGVQRTAFREWWLTAGDDAVEATARLSDDSITTLADDAAVAADGGLDLERRYATAIARTDASYGALDDVIRSVERLDDGQQIAAKTLIARTSDDGVRLWRQLDDSSRATMTSLDTASGFGRFNAWDGWRSRILYTNTGETSLEKQIFLSFPFGLHL